jgi:hypothetical protein
LDLYRHSIHQTSYNWNIVPIEDGFYWLAIEASDNQWLVKDYSNSYFEINNPDPPIVTVNYPNMENVLNGIVNITWTAFDPDGDSLNITLYYWDTNQWKLIDTNLTEEIYSWDTTLIPSGSGYLIRVNATDGMFISSDVSDTSFIINQAPTVTVTYPNGGETITGEVMITWTIDDPEGDETNVTIYCEINSEFFEILSSATNTSFTWNTTTYPNGDNCKIHIYGFDSYYNSAYDCSDDYFILDNPQPPIVEITKPHGGQIINGTCQITWDSDDPDGDSLTFDIYYWDSSQWVLITTGLTSNYFDWDTSSLPKGDDYQIRIDAFDGFFTTSDYSEPFIINQTPSVTVIYPNGGESLTGFVTVSWEGFDSDGETLFYEIAIFQGSLPIEIIESNIETTSVQINITKYETASNYRFMINVTDGLTYNQDFSDNYFTIVHNESPTVDLTSPTSYNSYSNSITITWTASDPDDDPLTFDLYYKKGGWSWLEIATEITGNSYVWDITGLPDDDDYLIRIRVSDGYFNYCSDILEGVFEINNPDAPYVYLNFSGGNLQGIVTIMWSGYDADGEILTYTLYYSRNGGNSWSRIARLTDETSYDWDTNSISDGTGLSLKIVASDGQYTAEDTSGTFSVDNPDSPQLNVFNVAGIVNGTVIISWSGNDPDGESLRYTIYYQIGSNDWVMLVSSTIRTSYHFDTTTVLEGCSCRIIVKASDGTLTTVDSTNYFIINNIEEEPIVNLTSPSGGETFTDERINITWNAYDKDLDYLEFSLYYYSNDLWVEIATGITKKNYQWNISNLPDASGYKIKIVVTDGLFTVEDELETSFTINKPDEPKIELLNPLGGEIVQETIRIIWIATDADGDNLTYCIEYFDNENWFEIVSGLTETFYDWDTTHFSDGEYFLRVKATDGIFVVKTETKERITIDNNDAPLITVLSPNGGEIIEGVTNIIWTASDPENDALSFSLFYWNETNWIEIATEITGQNYTWDTTEITAGTDYLIRIVATDGILTTTDESDSTFTIKNEQPANTHKKVWIYILIGIAPAMLIGLVVVIVIIRKRGIL